MNISEEGFLRSSYTYHISVADSLSVRGRYDVAVLELWVILWNFFDLVFVRKNFCPLLFFGEYGLNEKDFLCSVNISLVLFLGFGGITNMVPGLFSE